MSSVISGGNSGGSSSGTPGSIPITPPLLTNFTALNVGAASVNQSNGAIRVSTPAAGSVNLQSWIQAVPVGPYHIDMQFKPEMWNTNFNKMGFVWYAQGSNNYVDFVLQYDSGMGGYCFAHTKFLGPTAWNGHYTRVGLYPWLSPTQDMWLRIGDNGTNRYGKVSTDGVYWYDIVSTGRTDYITPTHVGFMLDSESGSGLSMKILSWHVYND